MGNKTRCLEPWNNVVIDLDGSFDLCTAEQTNHFGNIKDQTITEHFESDKMNSIRQDMIDGKPLNQFCNRCYQVETNNGYSRRQQMQSQPHYKLKNNPVVRTIQFKIGNLCNMKCRMCGPRSSNLIALEQMQYNEPVYPELNEKGLYKNWSDTITDKFKNDLLKILKNVTMVKFTGGEPFISPFHNNILDIIIESGYASQIELFYISNVHQIPDLFDKWEQFESVKVKASIDDLYERLEYIRTNSNFDTAIKNIQTLEAMPYIKVNINCLVMIYNIFNLENHKKFFSDLGFNCTYNNIVEPNALSSQRLPKHLKDKLHLSGGLKPFELYAKIKDLDSKDFFDFNDKLDIRRNTNFTEIFTEFK